MDLFTTTTLSYSSTYLVRSQLVWLASSSTTGEFSNGIYKYIAFGPAGEAAYSGDFYSSKGAIGVCRKPSKSCRAQACLVLARVSV